MKSNYTKNRTSYEWVYEDVDQYGDINDPIYTDSAKDALSWIASTGEGLTAQIALVRTFGSEANGIEQRDYAYAANGELPTEFPEEDCKVPKRYREEYKLALNQ